MYSFEYDDDYIYAAFMTQYGIDLNSIEYMHWWKFRSMFNSLTNQCEFVKIMEYRSIDLKDNMPKEQKAFYRKMKRIYALPSMDDEDKRTNAIAEALMGSGDLSGNLVGEAVNIEKLKEKYSLRVECPECGYKMPVFFTEDAECSGVMVACKGRNCHSIFEVTIKNGKQIK